jgi:hypothetical protein
MNPNITTRSRRPFFSTLVASALCVAAVACEGDSKPSLTNPSLTNPSPTAPAIAARIVAPPQNQSAAFNDSVTFTVVATGSEPLNYQWYNNGTPMANGTNVTGVTTPTVTMRVLQAFNAGTVRVDVSNPFGSDRATATLIVR